MLQEEIGEGLRGRHRGRSGEKCSEEQAVHGDDG